MAYTDEQLQAIQQEILGATNMQPQKPAPKQPDANDQWANYIEGQIKPQLRPNQIEGNSTTTVQPQQNANGTTDQPPRMSYEDIYKQLNPEPTQQIDEKTQKRNLLLGSIGDMFSAFHTAYSHARGVRPMVNPGESLTGRMRDRYDRLNKEYEARKMDYNAGMLRAKQMDEQSANAERNWKAQLERYRMQDENTKAKLAEEKAAREAKEKANKQKNDHLTQYEIAKAQGDRQKAAYYKALSEGKTNEQAMAIANATPKTKTTKRGGRSYASSKTVGNTTIYYDANGKEVKRIVKQPGVQTQGSQGTQKRDSNGNIIINY